MVMLGCLYLATALLSSLGAAAPLGDEDAPVNLMARAVTSGTVQQQPNPNYKRNGPMELAKVYMKYGTQMPKDLAAIIAADKNEIGSAAALPQIYDSEYLVPVTIGGQTLNLDLDTGSSDLWVYSAKLSLALQAKHSVYDPSKSSTSKPMDNSTWKIQYADGSGAAGIVATDTVNVGGVTVTKQAVEMATAVSAAFAMRDTTDGLIGMSFSNINRVRPNPQKTFFDNAKSSMRAGVLTADLKHNAPGSYDFGFIDSLKYTGDITYTDVYSKRGFWNFTSYYADTDTTLIGIADTGTTLLLLDDTVVFAYYKDVDGARYDSTQGGYTVPCDGDIPDFVFTVGDTDLAISGQYMAWAPLVDGSPTCFGGLQPKTFLEVSIFGDIMMKSIFTIFDLDHVRLGFAQKPT